MLTYAVEPWHQYWPDAKPLWSLHWAEIATHQDVIPLDVDMAAYADMDAAGLLHIVTVRDDNQLVGYHLSIVKGHLHYQGTLHAFTDIYWLSPASRKGLTGYRLFQYVEQTLKARGVVKMITACKVSLDVGALFVRQGWVETERTFTKYIGDGSVTPKVEDNGQNIYHFERA